MQQWLRFLCSLKPLQPSTFRACPGKQPADEDVIQEVVPDVAELPAFIDPIEAERTQLELWASAIENHALGLVDRKSVV